MELREHVDLHALNTLALPSRARFFASAVTERDIGEAVAFARAQGRALFVLGSGSNLVLAANIDALVLKLASRGLTVLEEDEQQVVFSAAAGEDWHALVVETLKRGWYGLENLALIPGTLGAAPVQNIGAYGVELERFVRSVRAYDLEAGAWVDLAPGDCRFSYRDSIFRRGAAQRFIISAVTLALSKVACVEASYGALQQELARRGVAQAEPADVFDAVVAIRRAKLPDPALIPNAGSFFKNPIIDSARFASLREEFPDIVCYPQRAGAVKLAAGWLIEQAGYKGRMRAGVGMHSRQALVLVNDGGVDAAQVLAYAEEVVDAVRRRFGVSLEREPLWIGVDGLRR